MNTVTLTLTVSPDCVAKYNALVRSYNKLSPENKTNVVMGLFARALVAEPLTEAFSQALLADILLNLPAGTEVSAPTATGFAG